MSGRVPPSSNQPNYPPIPSYITSQASNNPISAPTVFQKTTKDAIITAEILSKAPQPAPRRRRTEQQAELELSNQNSWPPYLDSPPTGGKEPEKSKNHLSTLQTSRIKVLKEFDCCETEGQISVEQGEMVEKVVANINGWTIVRNEKRQEGRVPTECLAMAVWIGVKTRECFGGEGQIDIHKDEKVVELIEDVDGWTKVRNDQGEEGLVPTKCLAKEQKLWWGAQTRECFGAAGQIDITMGEELEEVMADDHGWTTVRNKQGKEGLVPTKLLVGSSIKEWRANQNHSSNGTPGQIDVQKDEEVEEVVGNANGWTVIINSKGEEGAVPTKILVDLRQRSRKQWKVTEDYDSNGAPGLLNLKKEVLVEELKPPNGEWILVRNSSGAEGHVPKKHLRKMRTSNLQHKSNGDPRLLSIKPEELLEEVETDKEGYSKVKNAAGQEGYVPTSCLD